MAALPFRLAPFFLAVFLTALAAGPARACQCPDDGPAGFLDHADMLAEGEILSLESDAAGWKRARLRVGRVLKGQAGGTLVLVNAAPGAPCQAPPPGKPGETALIGAWPLDRSKDMYGLSRCSMPPADPAFRAGLELVIRQRQIKRALLAPAALPGDQRALREPAAHALSAGDFAAALDHVRADSGSLPGDAWLRGARARALAGLGRLEDALALLERLRAEDHSDPALGRIQAWVALSLGRPDALPPGWTDFTALDLSGLALEGMNFTGADLSGSLLAGARLARADFTEATLDGTQLDGAELTGATFNRALVPGARFDNARLAGASLKGLRLSTGGLLSRLNPFGGPTPPSFRGADISGAYFGESRIAGADFTAAIHDGMTVWPPGQTPPGGARKDKTP